jgi:lactate dehydrogenase-like 2-hydroxyacid dehydrogenase
MKIVGYGLQGFVSRRLEKTFGSRFSARGVLSDPEDADENTEIAVINVRSSVNEKTLRKMPRLKAVVCASAGLDNVDAKAAMKRGIEIRRAADYSSASVAELAIGLALAGLRDLEGMLSEGEKLPLSTQLCTGL